MNPFVLSLFFVFLTTMSSSQHLNNVGEDSSSRDMSFFPPSSLYVGSSQTQTPPLSLSHGNGVEGSNSNPEMGLLIFASTVFQQPQECRGTKRAIDEEEEEEEEDEEEEEGVDEIENNKNLCLKLGGDEAQAAKSSASGKTKLCARGHWRPAEDEKLKELVAQYGPQNWNLIAENLEGRSGNLIV